MIPRIQSQNELIGNQKEKEAFTDAIKVIYPKNIKKFPNYYEI